MKYYLYYDESAKVNYIFLFTLFSKSNKGIIKYKNQKELSAVLNYSPSTVSKILKDVQYNMYFTLEENKITLNTEFKRGKAISNKFVVLTEKEILFLIEQNNNQLIKYYLYIKYYCGYSKNKNIDTTANQILYAIGYSTSGKNKDNLCKYNLLLQQQGFIQIQKIKDNRGYNRNIYSMSI